MIKLKKYLEFMSSMVSSPYNPVIAKYLSGNSEKLFKAAKKSKRQKDPVIIEVIDDEFGDSCVFTYEGGLITDIKETLK